MVLSVPHVGRTNKLHSLILDILNKHLCHWIQLCLLACYSDTVLSARVSANYACSCSSPNFVQYNFYLNFAQYILWRYMKDRIHFSVEGRVLSFKPTSIVKIVYGRWQMNEIYKYGVLVEWYWQRNTEALGENPIPIVTLSATYPTWVDLRSKPCLKDI